MTTQSRAMQLVSKTFQQKVHREFIRQNIDSTQLAQKLNLLPVGGLIILSKLEQRILPLEETIQVAEALGFEVEIQINPKSS